MTVTANKKENKIKTLVLAALFLALTLLLPFLTMQIPQIGSMLSPMHIPVLLCGFICGWKYGLIVGAVAPILRFLLFSMPPIFPTGLAMTFELAAYGACAGIVYMLLSKKLKKVYNVYASLIIAMICGRIVWGLAMSVIALFAVNVEFGLAAFMAGAFINAVPGIILHILIIPILVLALEKAGISK